MLGRPGEPRGRMVDINLLAEIGVPRRGLSTYFVYIPWVLAALGVLLLVFLFLERGNVSAKLSNVKSKVAEAEARSRVLILPPEVRELQARVEATKKRLSSIQSVSTDVKARQWPWDSIVQIISDLKPEGIHLRTITQKETSTIILEGDADTEAFVVAYAGALRQSKLFSAVSIQSIATEKVPLEQTPVVVRPGLPPSFVPSLPLSPTPTASPTAVPTPAFDYVVVSTNRYSIPGGHEGNLIKGWVLDESGAPVEGLTSQLSSCCPQWSTQYPRDFDLPSPGTFEFLVERGTFSVEILNAAEGRGQIASGLTTEDQGTDEHFEWQVVFQKVTDGPVMPPRRPPASASPPTPAPTPTFVPTPGGTPVLGPAAPSAPQGTPKAAPTSTSTPVPTPTATHTPTPTSTAPPSPTPTATAIFGPAVATSPTAVPTKEVIRFTIVLTLRTLEETKR